MVRGNFFMETRKRNQKELLDFIEENGLKTYCPRCSGELVTEFEATKCKQCNYKGLTLKRNKLVGLFAFKFGASRDTVNDYLDTMIAAGKVEYVAEKDSYRTL